MTRYFACTLTMVVPDDGPPTIHQSHWQEAGRHSPNIPETAAQGTPPLSPHPPDPLRPLTEAERSYLGELAGQADRFLDYAARIALAQTYADGAALRAELKEKR